ncbi:MAG: hypothetical protein LC794_04915 [Acidobacteria bacterium]|nr:hypothetical protein [Acidobacteriota bacterium]
MILGVEGFSRHKWTSVERVRSFYSRALSDEFELQAIDSPADLANPALDAILAFVGHHAWRVEPHPDCPMLFVMHGGAILNRDFLGAHVKRLRASDVLIVTCTSDITILRKFFGEAAPQICLVPLPVDTDRFSSARYERMQSGSVHRRG